MGQSSSPSHPLQTRKLVHTNQPNLARAELNFPSSSSAHHRGAFPRSAFAGAHLGPLQHLYPTGPGRLGLFLSRINVFLENSHSKALIYKPYLSVLLLHFIQPYCHKQLSGGGSNCHLPVIPDVTYCPHHYPGLREHSLLTSSLIPGCITAGHFVSRHWAGRKPSWHLQQERVEN